MAIAVDNTGNVEASGTTTATLSAFTITGSNICLIVSVCDQDTGSAVSGVTANGAAMTQIDFRAISGGQGVYLYGLYGATSGDIVATRTGTGDRLTICAVSYTGVSSSTAIGSLTKTEGSGTSTAFTGTLTTPVDNCWTTMGSYVSSGGDTTTAGAGTTKRVTGPEIEDHWDSNAAISPAAITTLNVNTGGSFAYAYVMAAIEPFVAATGGTKRRALMGIGR